MAVSRRPYHEQVDIENTKKLRELTGTLPSFTKDFFRGIEPVTSSRTRIAYAYDLRIFFEFLISRNPEFAKKGIEGFTVQDLDQITLSDLEEYTDYLKYYDKDEEDHINKERGIKRKLSSLKSFYNYYYRKEDITTNPAALVSLPKIPDKEIIRLEPNEVALLLDAVENGDHLSKHQAAFHEKNKVRDLAMMTLLLGTGIRVSECVGLDLTDVDLENTGIRIHRKGGKEVVVYFSDEVKEALVPYIDERKRVIAEDGSENALFLSMQNRRISVRAVENLVKKYAKTVTSLKKITPHKLRSTYGTSLYRETGDIYLVADVLGHSDVNTTKKHYAALDEERRRYARDKVRLRDSLNETTQT
ncbi:MAG: tyrosine-type recombinase/integrase [Lachnospiraceae bacterium]|jgi:integrase/recombinase XerC|nr:tyrosine-type recombinase/integrase [Lachnospiraceae bacterium]